MLKEGMRLSQEEFRERYENSHLRKVQLVNGRVRIPSPVHWRRHGRPHGILIGWLCVYESHFPNVVEFGDNATVHLDGSNEVQPDALLRKIDGACGLEENDYLRGPPELVGEISNTSESFDLNQKKDVYEICGVKEYVVWRTRVNEVVWFVLRNGRYQRLEPVDGLIKSETFPGLVLNVTALLEGNTAKVIETLVAAINEL